MEITVVDGAHWPNDLKTASIAFAGGKEKVDKGAPYSSIYNEREKSFQIMSLYNERIFLDATGHNITEEQLWEVIKKLNVEKLLKKQDTSGITYNIDSTTVKFEGIITNAKNDCWVDGTCSIEVNNKWWIAIVYGKRDPSFRKKERGLVTGIRFTKDNESIGKRVKVYAKIKNNNQLTLEGSKTYYAKTIE